MTSFLPIEEPRRLEALQRLNVLDTPAEAAFDRITGLAARLFRVPVALVSLVDSDRQWFKSKHGVDLCETSRDIAFCAHALGQREALVVPDTTLDPRFCDNPLVTGEFAVRFYAGAPLIGREGLALGTLCVLDTKPRGFNEEDRKTLEDLAAVVVDELELRLSARQLEEESEARRAAQKALDESRIRFQSAFEMSAIGMALVSPEGRWIQVNGCLCRMLGYSEEELRRKTSQDITFPADLPRDLELVEQLLAGDIDSYELEKRYLRGDGQLVWVAISVALVRDGRNQPEYFVVQVQDIGGRKQIEDELRQSEARKAAIVNTALDCIISIDAQSRILEWNPAAEKTFGFSREYALGRELPDLIVPPELRAAHRAGLEKYSASGDGPILGQRLELPAVRADGQTITIELAVVPIPGSEPPLFTGHLRDISGRREIEERLRLLESVVVNANDAILITEAEPIDEPGPRILYANDAYCRMSGYALEEIIGRTPRILQGEGTSDEARARIRRALKRWKPVVVDMLNYKKDGTPFWVELSITPVANEKGWFTHWVSIQRDITERRQTLELLRESEGRYGRIAANVPGMVYQFVLHPDGAFSFAFVSEGCREIYGLEPAQIMDDASVVLDCVHPDDAQEFSDSVARSAQTLDPWEWQGRVLLAGREEKWIRGSSRPKREDDGRIVWDGILFDVTQRIKSVEALRHAKEEAVAARIEAERANAAKSEFLSRMSHELRTPLNAILGFGQLLEAGGLPPRAQEQAGYILKGGYHLLDLINEVLDIARIESGRLTLAPEAVPVFEVISEALDLVAPLAGERSLQLVQVPDDAARFALCDRQRFKQVLLNLLSNAVKYNRDGGQVRVLCSTTDRKEVRIEVSDTGRGIAREDLERVWVPFERLDADIQHIEGTGIGLSLSRHLAQAMGGTLNARSELGRGSTFTLELPAAPDPGLSANQEKAAPVPTEPAPDPAPVSTRHVVLYIEDNLPNLHLVQAIWAGRPEIRLLSATNGATGLELAHTHQPDVILLDLHLQGISGEEVLGQLREDQTTQNIPVVVVSADATAHQIERLHAAGADAYLTKPLDIDRFRQVLDGMLRTSAQRENDAK